MRTEQTGVDSWQRSMAWLRASIFSAALVLPSVVRAGDELGNWFNDPFVQVRSAVADCPTPQGPVSPRSQMVTEEHSRVERGTSCYLAGKCEKPNAYMYDAAIAADLKTRFAASGDFGASSLWLTVKRKFVWVEGCTRDDDDLAIEHFVRATANVEMVLVDVRHGQATRVPYKVAPDAAR